MNPLQARLRSAAWRGARWGALGVGIVAFLCGIGLCCYFHLPIPPVFLTEIGVLLGATLGALVGYLSCYAVARAALWGMLLGAGVGLPLALYAGSPGLWVGCWTLGGLLGYQSGLSRDGARHLEDWKLHVRG